jgi:hypothetical protein
MKNLNKSKYESPVTIALHFQYIMPGEWKSDTSVGANILKRVLQELIPSLPIVGSVIVRMGQLFYTQDLDGDRESSWRMSIARDPVKSSLLVRQHIDLNAFPLDRVFVIVLSGNVSGLLGPMFQKLRRYRTHQLLFALQIDANEWSHEIIYLTQSAAIGTINRLAKFELGFDIVEYEEEIPRMLQKIGIDSSLSATSMAALLKLFGDD